MRFQVDLNLFQNTAHSPSFLALQKSSHGAPAPLRDYCVPVNSYFPPADLMSQLKNNLEQLLKYYPAQNEAIALKLGEALDVRPDCMVVANGSTELISWINVLHIQESLATPVPTFGRWTDLPTETGKKVHTFLLRPENHFEFDGDAFVAFVRQSKSKVAVLCNPNNPTGTLISRNTLLRLFDQLSDLDLIVVDESFIDFSSIHDVPTILKEAQERPNVLLLKSLGKNFGLHGLRMGFSVSNPRIAARLRAHIPKWNLNGIAQFLIEELSSRKEQYEISRRRVIEDTQYLKQRLDTVFGLKAYAPAANFVYAKLLLPLKGTLFRDQLLTGYGILIRECGNKIGSTSQYFRIATRQPQDIDYLVGALSQLVDTPMRVLGTRDVYSL